MGHLLLEKHTVPGVLSLCSQLVYMYKLPGMYVSCWRSVQILILCVL